MDTVEFVVGGVGIFAQYRRNSFEEKIQEDQNRNYLNQQQNQ